MSNNNHDDLERELTELLIEGQMANEQEQKEKERKLISPKYEIRIQTTHDPIVEETLTYRKIAKELDGRYDAYMERAGHRDPDARAASEMKKDITKESK